MALPSTTQLGRRALTEGVDGIVEALDGPGHRQAGRGRSGTGAGRCRTGCVGERRCSRRAHGQSGSGSEDRRGEVSILEPLPNVMIETGRNFERRLILHDETQKTAGSDLQVPQTIPETGNPDELREGGGGSTRYSPSPLVRPWKAEPMTTRHASSSGKNATVDIPSTCGDLSVESLLRGIS